MAEIIFGIDHGNGNMKGETSSFPCGIVRYTAQPGRFMNEDILEYEGAYYTLSETKMPFKADKTVDDDYFILTLFTLVQEARKKNINLTGKDVVLGVGLPPADFGQQAVGFKQYFIDHSRHGINFRMNDKPVSFYLKDVFVSPQNFAAVMCFKASLLKKYRTVNCIDIGDGTVDLLVIRNGKPDLSVRVSERSGMAVLRSEISNRIQQNYGIHLDSSDVEQVLMGEETILEEEILKEISSIENQTKYYTKKVGDTPNWTLHEIYSDEGKSGTSTQHRTEFKRMIEDAAQKKIDLILCASVSRFARNMSDCMTLVRQLKSMNPSHPVGVYFETENIYTLDPDCKQNLSIHAMLADWESANKSRRMILSYDQRICTGQYPVLDLLGYRHTKEGELIIQPEEAKTVRFIFLAYIGGYDCDEIAEILTERERPTLRGRTDWNASMVMNVMSNERRWGELEARKTIVIDYVEHKSKKNEHDRVSAYEEDHHEPIVSREIALAAQMVKKSSRKMTEGVPDFSVIHKGNLKGFVSICPGWGGIDGSALLEICQEVYEEEELEELNHKIRIWSGEEQGKVVSMALSGYQVPHGIYFLNKSLPALTVGRRRIKFSKACHEKLNYCRWVEILYHPIIQTIIIRQTTPDNPNCIEWEKEDGKLVSFVSSSAFSTAIYESLHWKKEFSFKFRGITKERGMSKILVFSLDEPQIIVGKKYKNHPDVEKESNQPFGFVKYKTDTEQENKPENNNIVCAYPEEWMKRRIGINYFIREQRDSMINAITEEDIEETGVVVENPVIGHIPSRQEIVNELEELLMTM